ncbi:TPA: hypothetical protein ACPO6A_001738 [Haemophilus influenzae]|nr:hypothetical protein [Haemophilus influenzae]
MDLLKQMKKIADKQGVSMIMADNTLITTYNTCSYKRKALKHYH